MFDWFGLCLMVYQPSWVIQYQSHPCRRTAMILFKPIPFPRVLV